MDFWTSIGCLILVTVIIGIVLAGVVYKIQIEPMNKRKH